MFYGVKVQCCEEREGHCDKSNAFNNTINISPAYHTRLGIMDYTGTLRPKGVTFPDLRYLKRVGISQVEVHERVGKSVIGG